MYKSGIFKMLNFLTLVSLSIRTDLIWINRHRLSPPVANDTLAKGHLLTSSCSRRHQGSFSPPSVSPQHRLSSYHPQLHFVKNISALILWGSCWSLVALCHMMYLRGELSLAAVTSAARRSDFLIDAACNLHISTAATTAYQGRAAITTRAYLLPAAAATKEAGEEHRRLIGVEFLCFHACTFLLFNFRSV